MQGRIAVLEAVMAARNKQISVGEELIDRMMDAIQKDRLRSPLQLLPKSQRRGRKQTFAVDQRREGIFRPPNFPY